MGDENDSTKPSAPGWYPDPWSADGKGERYFDGKRWGSSDRPANQAAAASVTSLRRARRARRVRMPGAKRMRVSSTWIWVGVLVVAALGLTVLQQHRHSSSGPNLPTNVTLPAGLGGRPPVGTEEASRPLGVLAPAPPTGGKFEFLEHQPDAAQIPVAWDPCRPIHFVINPLGAPPDGEKLVHDAIGEVATKTGLVFTDDGTTTETPDKDRNAYLPERYGNKRWAPVLIAWSNENAFPSLSGYIAGVGSPIRVIGNDQGRFVYVSGSVVLDSHDLSTSAIRDRSVARAIVLHELGHLVGLDHTSDRSEIMFSEAQFNVRDYGAGDLRGLHALGTQPCFPDV